jgi:hypothetical protein
VLLVLLTGCATPTIYSWGQYENVIYAAYTTPDKMPVERQVELLEADYQKARSQNKPVPPGWHAHLGYLYYHLGKADQAKQEFETEKARFPESAVFMDRMLANLSKQ